MHVLARFDDVVALERGERDERHVVEPDPLGELAVLLLDRGVHLGRVLHEVHLVDGHDHPLDAEQRDQEAVASGLGQHALAGVDQDHGDVGGRRPGHHVAGVLLVAGGVGHDELAALGREEAVGDIDRDALLAFGGQAVEQQSEVEVGALRADLGRVGGEGGEVVFEDQVGLVQQAPDQRALAVVDTAARDEAQQALVLMRGEVGLDVGGDQI